ncbi:hypothetical protein FVO59_09615 [Microbacterium esteraromaticum]|uniref:Uncharacterized protein n=1 Tax=Microbacterium esteraromaticum TaxID=57043 RepID=A0A7D8ALH8_9MICO|nr:hypothetical protein [Microbacterium esteraromaticum]QMU97447.1 hypothetical protein FVO59_09615 [Microbacterium esteraromaticum]
MSEQNELQPEDSEPGVVWGAPGTTGLFGRDGFTQDAFTPDAFTQEIENIAESDWDVDADLLWGDDAPAADAGDSPPDLDVFG